jgi:cytochrome c biogenesis protein CcdA
MTGQDFVQIGLAGLVSCLTPEAVMLLPVTFGAIGARGLLAALGAAIGTGVSFVVAGPISAWLGDISGFGPIALRWFCCLLLGIEGGLLSRQALADEFALFTGGSGSEFRLPSGDPFDGVTRLFFLGLLTGGTFIPRVGPALGNASLMAADKYANVQPLGALFVFGLAAAIPWILAGRVLRIPIWLAARDLIDGMAGKRVMALVLVGAAAAGFLGFDAALVREVDPMLPDWVRVLATAY